MFHPNPDESKSPGPDRTPPSFDYTAIPVGYYDEIMRKGHPVRRAWHLQKFERVLDLLPTQQGGSILDIGCFAGTFLSLVEPTRFQKQLGVDILPAQVDFANAHFGTDYRQFKAVGSVAELNRLDELYDVITLIEVIEHLTHEEIALLMDQGSALLKPGGKLILSTPNYLSLWPLLEVIVNLCSDISYLDQHLTRLTFWNAPSKLAQIYPPLRQKFRLECKTTTHFVSPFLAPLVSVSGAMKVSRLLKHHYWPFPFGCLILLVFERTAC